MVRVSVLLEQRYLCSLENEREGNLLKPYIKIGGRSKNYEKILSGDNG